MNDLLTQTLEADAIDTTEAVAVRQEAPPAVVPPAAPPAIADGPGALLGAIVQMASDPRVDVAKLDALLNMQARMEARQAEIEFNRALARLPPMHVKKNGKIDLTRKDGSSSGSVAFARWEDIAQVIEPMLAAEGFRLMFDSQPRTADGGGLIVTGTLLHRDGHSKTASMPLALDTGPGRNNLQAMGSTLSYGRRYCAEMLLNIVRENEDDDGRKGGAQFLKPDQVEEVSKLVSESETDPRQFMEWVFGDNEPHTYAEIPAEKFVGVINALKGKLRRLKAEGAKQ